jgi:hypothetical protein
MRNSGHIEITVVAALALLATLFVIGLIAGISILEGWIAFLLYRELAPEDWITIGLWPMVGIAFLTNVVLNALRPKA